MGNWRVFIGLWDDPEVVTHLDELHEDWAAARDQLDTRLARWATDSCEDCVRTAAGELGLLRAAAPGQEFVGEVEGEDYLLIDSGREEIRGLWDTRLSAGPPLISPRSAS